MRQATNFCRLTRKSNNGDGQNRQRGGNESLKVERRDKSKQIKKGDNGQKKISIESLRKEKSGGKGPGKKEFVMNKKGGKGGQQGKGDHQKGDRRPKKDLGHKGGKGGKFGRKGGKPKDVKDADALDKELEGYWVKGGHVEQGK